MAKRNNTSNEEKGRERRMPTDKGEVTPGSAGNKPQSPGRRPGAKSPGGHRRKER